MRLLQWSVRPFGSRKSSRADPTESAHNINEAGLHRADSSSLVKLQQFSQIHIEGRLLLHVSGAPLDAKTFEIDIDIDTMSNSRLLRTVTILIIYATEPPSLLAQNATQATSSERRTRKSFLHGKSPPCSTLHYSSCYIDPCVPSLL